MCEGTCGPTCLSPDRNGILVGIYSDFVHIVHSECSFSSAQSFLLSDSLSIIWIFRLLTPLT